MSSWIGYWRWFFDQARKGACMPKYCKILEPGFHQYFLRGGHMELAVKDRKWYILPICGEHNAPSGKYDRNGTDGPMLTKQSAMAVQIPRV
jgi:hypothetical protein